MIKTAFKTTKNHYEAALLELNSANNFSEELDELTDAVYEFVEAQGWVTFEKDTGLADFVDEIPEGIDERAANEAFLKELGFNKFYSPDSFPEGGTGDCVYVIEKSEDEIRRIAAKHLEAAIEIRDFQP